MARVDKSERQAIISIFLRFFVITELVSDTVQHEKVFTRILEKGRKDGFAFSFSIITRELKKKFPGITVVRSQRGGAVRLFSNIKAISQPSSTKK